MNFLAPGEVASAACGASGKKRTLSMGQLIVLGMLAGAYIGFGANLATVVSNDLPKFLGNGFTQLVFGAVFSTGLMLVVIGGSELFTGNNMFMTIGALNGDCTWGDLLKNWVIIWLANFAGSLVLVYILAGGFYGFFDGVPAVGLFSGAVGAKAIAVALGKVKLTFASAFCRAILCNWLVCMAVWLALASKDTIGKIFGIFFPIMAFVASGFEHSVANMFFIPMGILVSHIPGIVDFAAQATVTATMTPDAAAAAIAAYKSSLGPLTWSAFLIKNLIPVTLGNIVGGGIFVGSVYWYSYLLPQSKAAKKNIAA
jgi:formate transporter